MAIDARTLCVGDVSFVRDALHAAGAVLPEHAPYPDVLKPYLRRETGWVRRFQHLRRKPVFVKPAEGWKRFTGRVIDHPEQTHEFRISGNQPLWWSAPVQWLSEWRVYCASGEVLDVQRAAYTPGEGPMIDMPLVEKALADFAASEGAPSGVALDFGVLSTGETALVEANDGFAFGAYGSVSGETMWRIWAARWPELVAGRRRSDSGPPSPAAK